MKNKISYISIFIIIILLFTIIKIPDLIIPNRHEIAEITWSNISPYEKINLNIDKETFSIKKSQPKITPIIFYYMKVKKEKKYI